jgi:hypothetical protein
MARGARRATFHVARDARQENVSRHRAVAALLAQRDSGSTVATTMVSMRCKLPLTGQTRMSPIFCPSAAGVATNLTVESWLSMQPESPTVSALLKALSPADSASGGGVHQPASEAQGAELRKLLSAHLVASSAGEVTYEQVEFDHSVGVSELSRSFQDFVAEPRPRVGHTSCHP